MLCVPSDFVTCCILRSCVVWLCDSSDVTALHRHGSVASVASAPRDARAGSLHIRTQGPNMGSSRVVSQFARMLCDTGWCRVVHVVPRADAMPARVFRNSNPHSVLFCTAAHERSPCHGTMLCWEVVSAARRVAPKCFFLEPRLSAICPPVVPLHCSLLLTPTTLVPKHVSQNNGWILFECVTRACKRQSRPWLPKLCISLYQNRSAGVVGPKPLGFCDFQVWSGGLGTNPESELQNHVFIIKLSCFWVGSPGTDF